MSAVPWDRIAVSLQQRRAVAAPEGQTRDVRQGNAVREAVGGKMNPGGA
jgi:hypothetical protein